MRRRNMKSKHRNKLYIMKKEQRAASGVGHIFGRVNGSEGIVYDIFIKFVWDDKSLFTKIPILS